MKTEAIRWSVNRAAAEFQIDRRTLAARIAKAGFAPDETGTYSTQEIVRSIYGDLAGAKLRKALADASLAELELGRSEGRLIDAELVERVWNDAMTNLRAIVLSADLPKVTRGQLIKQLHDIPIREYTESAIQSGDDDSAADA